MKTGFLSVRLEPEMDADVDRACKLLKIKRSTFTEDAIRDRLAVLRYQGVLPSAPSLPQDAPLSPESVLVPCTSSRSR